MNYLPLHLSKIWKQVFVCLSVTLTAHGLLLGYVPWCHVVDMKRVYLAPFTTEAVIARFFDTGNVSVHVWKATDRPHYYTLLQETQLEKQQATGSLEVVQLRDKLFVPEGSMLGVSTGEVETMRSEFDRDATMYVSDVCLQSASAVNASHSGGVSSTTEMPHVRRFLELALPYALTFLPCPCHDCRDSIIELLDNEDEMRDLHISRWELLELLERTHPKTVTTLQPAEANDSATGDSGWMDGVTRDVNTSVTQVTHNSAWTLSDLTTNPVNENHSSRELTASTLPTARDGNKSDSGWFLPPWVFNDSSAAQSLPEPPDTNTSSHADATVVNQTGNGTTLLGEASTSTEDWRALSTDVNVSRRAENSTTTESVLTKNFRNWLLSQLPLWALDNDSFGNQALLEEMIKKHRDDMVLVPGEDGTLPQDGSPASAASSHDRYRTVVGLVIWNVVVTMLLFTVIVALFLVCSNNRRARFRVADSYTVTTDNEPMISKAGRQA